MKLIPLSGSRSDATWGRCATPVGETLVAFAPEGVLWLSFGVGQRAEDELAEFWRGGRLIRDDAAAQKMADRIFAADDTNMALLVEGTPFQIKVWQTLMTVPRGGRISYSELACRAGMPRAVRAVATAIGRNNISYLIPCHRIVRSNGTTGQYRWGSQVKKALLEWERGAK